MIRYICFLFLSFVVTIYLPAQRNSQWAVPVETQKVNNLYLVDTGVYRAAQPDAAAFVELEQMGIREVLNLRYFCSNDKPATGTSLALHHVKMLAGNCDWDKVVKALQIIKERKGPIVIHCKHGADRTGLMVAMYRIIFQGWDKESAIAELENGGYDFHTIYANIPSFIRNVDIETMKKAVMQ